MTAANEYLTPKCYASCLNKVAAALGAGTINVGAAADIEAALWEGVRERGLEDEVNALLRVEPVQSHVEQGKMESMATKLITQRSTTLKVLNEDEDAITFAFDTDKPDVVEVRLLTCDGVLTAKFTSEQLLAIYQGYFTAVAAAEALER